MTEDFELFDDFEDYEIIEPDNDPQNEVLPSVFTGDPERIGNPRSPFKKYLIFDYDRVTRWMVNANERVRNFAHYAVITESANFYPNSKDTILWWVMNAVVSGGTLFVLDEYDKHEYLENWERGRKKDGYIPYIKP